MAQAHVPYFGGGFNSTYCSHDPSTALWGWSVTGCPTAADPSFVMKFPSLYTYVSEKSGKNDDATAKRTRFTSRIRATAGSEW
jgi:hypothetical protein